MEAFPLHQADVQEVGHLEESHSSKSDVLGQSHFSKTLQETVTYVNTASFCLVVKLK